MKKFLLGSLLCLLPFLPAVAQSQVKYGIVSYDSLFCALPEYGEMCIALDELRGKFKAEAEYNDMAFKRMFTEFLDGQKDFPQNIMLKRQRDLQVAMEKGLAFRQEADSLLRLAEADLRKPLCARLDSVIAQVAQERGYECVVNKDVRSHLFFAPGAAEDAMPFVMQKIVTTIPEK